MKGRNNTSRIFDRAWAVIAALAALLLLFCKMSGRLTWSWPGVVLGYVGIMCSLMLCCVLLANAVILACKLHRWNRTRRVMNRIRKDFKLLAHGEVLDKAAKRYNLHRNPQETDIELQNRILLHITMVDQMKRNAERLEKRLKEPPELCVKCWNEGCRNNEALRASKVETCLLCEEGLIPEDAGAYVREDE